LDFNFTVHENITRTQAIIRELNRSLDPEKAGELGDHLVSLYDYFDNRLQEANVKKNKEIIVEIRTRLTELRDAWNESLNQLSEAPAPAPTPAAAPAPVPVAQPIPVAASAPPPSSSEYTGLSLMG
jgi:flagellar protein FliS